MERIIVFYITKQAFYSRKELCLRGNDKFLLKHLTFLEILFYIDVSSFI